MFFYLCEYIAAPNITPNIANVIERTTIATPCPIFPRARQIIPKTNPAIPKAGGKNKSDTNEQM
jgi:hypothetical protein